VTARARRVNAVAFRAIDGATQEGEPVDGVAREVVTPTMWCPRFGAWPCQIHGSAGAVAVDATGGKRPHCVATTVGHRRPSTPARPPLSWHRRDDSPEVNRA